MLSMAAGPRSDPLMSAMTEAEEAIHTVMAQERAVISVKEQQWAAAEAGASGPTQATEEIVPSPRPAGPGPKVEIVSRRVPRKIDPTALVRSDDYEDE